MTIKLRTKVNFPATVNATGGLSVSKANGAWTVEPDWSYLTLETSLPDAIGRQLWTFEPSANAYRRTTIQALLDSLPPGPTGPTGPTGPAGTNGTNGTNGAGYGGSSTTSLLIANSTTKVFTTQAGLAYQVGNYVRASSAANGANFMEGLVSAYSGTSLSIAVSKIGGSGTFADWNFQTAGAPGAGDLLSTNNLSDVAAKYTAKDNISIHGSDVASATTTNLETATGDLIDVTGTTTITAITLSDGHERTVRFTGILTLTHGASLVLPGSASITTAAGDTAVFRGYAAGVVRCIGYSKISGKPVIANTPTEVGAAALVGNQNLTGGFTATSYSLGTVTTGTVTPSAANGNMQHLTANGAFTLDPPSATCCIDIEVLNGASAGTITTSGFTKVNGDTYATTNANKYIFHITKTNSYSRLSIEALQ